MGCAVFEELQLGEINMDKIARELVSVAKALTGGVGYELYAKGADRVAHQTKVIKSVAEKIAKSARENKSPKSRMKLVKELEKWLEVSQGEVKQLKRDNNILEGYK